MVLDQETLRKIVKYCPETGELTWEFRNAEYFSSKRSWKSWNSKHAGKSCGYVNEGRLCIRVLGVDYPASHIAFLWVTGNWPVGQIDHIDQNPLNNSWENIRQVSNSENQKNLPMRRDNKSGVTGVSWHRKTQKWRAYICVDRKIVHLGVFLSFSDAARVRREAEVEYGFHPNHGRRESLTAKRSRPRP